MSRPGVDLVVRGADVITDGVRSAVDVAVQDGRIAAVSARGTFPVDAATTVMDAAGAWLLPGGIDPHVHAGAPFCDDLDVVARGAARSGLTTLGVYAHAVPGDDPALAAERLVEWATGNAADVVLHWRLNRDSPIDHQVAAATGVGITTFKVFMSYRARGLQWTDAEILDAMYCVGAAGGRMAVHAECGDIIHALEERQPVHDAASFLAARPPETESEAVRRALVLGHLAGCPILIPHLSSAEGLAAYAAARGPGDVLETCPQYLLLDDDDARRHGTLAKIGPPLRPPHDAVALSTAVDGGRIDLLGSDHAPYSATAKDEPMDRAPFGMPGVETLLPLALDRFGPEITSLVCGAGPARALGISTVKGSIRVGLDADLVLVDPLLHTEVHARDLSCTAGWTPYEGTTVRGTVVAVWSRGMAVADDLSAGRHVPAGTHPAPVEDAGRP